MKTLFSTLVIGLAVLSSAAYALDLAEARTRDMVCERADGTIAASGSASPEVAKLVSSVNAGRKAEYQRIASEQKQPAEVAAKLAAEQLRRQGHKACN